jgi:hypothetical protein
MTCFSYLKFPGSSCPYSVPLPDSVHLRKCKLRVGICQEAYWRYAYRLCLTFRDGEAEGRMT